MIRRLRTPGSLQLIAKNVADGTRPSATSAGTSLTPTQNSYPSATECIASGSITTDIFAVEILFETWGITTEARSTIVNIYLGGQLWIPNLLVQSGTFVTGGASSYYFPLYGAAGQAVSAAASVSSANVTAGRILVYLYGKPHGDVWAGTVCRSFGADTANSRGTLVTPGAASEGAYTELGTLSETLRCWEFGLSNNDTSTVNASYFVDTALGDATNKRLVHVDSIVTSTNSETTTKASSDRYAPGFSGDKVYGRVQYGGTAETDTSMIVYGVG